MATPVNIQVNGVAGPRCTVEATTEWIVQQVHEAIFEKISVPVDWQVLFKETTKLHLRVTIGSLMEDPSRRLQLTLVVEDTANDPEPGALREAIRSRDATAALRLLRRPRLLGLNEQAWMGCTALILAIDAKLYQVALAILGRPDFTAVSQSNQLGWTALHVAACHGHLHLCRAIVSRADFMALLATTNDGQSALQIARANDHAEAAAFLEEAVAEL